MKCLRSFGSVSRMDIVRNEEVRRRAGIEWVGHANKMDAHDIWLEEC